MVIQNRPTSPPVQSVNISITSSSSSSTSTTLNHPQAPFINNKQFSENFWGEKINGFDVLCQNLKYSLTSVKDLEQFVRESLNCEDTYGRLLNKLVSQINKFSTNGSFNPVWSTLKELNEKYSTSHIQLVHQLQELIKEIQRYNEELSKRIKKIRENEQQTQIVVQSFQEIQQGLSKTKENYHNLCSEFEKQRRQLDSQQLSQYSQLSQQQVSSSNLIGLAINSSNPLSSNQTSGQPNLSSLANTITTNKVSQLLKLEKKMKLALDDYKSSIEKYNLIRVDFERKLADSCNQFQYAEETHLKQMRSFIDSYSRLISNINSNKQVIFNEFNLKLNEHFTVDYLIQLFIENKRTGTERPDVAQFIESTAVNSTSQPAPTPLQQQTLNENEFNLVLNNSSSIANPSSFSLAPAPLPPPISPLSYNQALIQQPIDLVDSRGSDYSLLQNQSQNPNNANSRATPTFFISTSSLYSQFTNSASNTTLNSIQHNGTSQHSVARSSPVSQSPVGSAGEPTTQQQQQKRNDGKGLNIFNVDFLGRNKNKEKKAAAAQKTSVPLTQTGDIKPSKFSRNKKSKQALSTSSNQYENLSSTSTTTSTNLSLNLNLNLNLTNPNLSISNTSGKDSTSIHSEDSNNPNELTPTQTSANSSIQPQQQNQNQLTISNNNQSGSVTARSISSMSFDLLDQLKISNGSDIDSEGYSLRPDSSVDLRRKANDNLKNDDMNNYYGSSSTSSDSDSDSEDAEGGPVKVMLKINPKSEVNSDKGTSNEVLREISKNLQLKHPGLQVNNLKIQQKKRTYYYNYGTANPDQAQSGWAETSNMTRSVSVGSVANSHLNLNLNQSSNSNTSKIEAETKIENSSLLDLDLNFSPRNSANTSMPGSLSLSKVNENSLYNIDEDREVESSFQYGQINFIKKSGANAVSSSPANLPLNNNSGRFTPACFPGRTTPDFRHTTSLFEQQGTRASIISPLTISSGSEIIPIAIAFNETIHAYFKIGDSTKFKIKCFGCMKISFPFAILKILAIELPQLEFRLSNLQIANQDLKLNNQLLERLSFTEAGQISEENLSFKFISNNLVTELKQQHQQNKQAAFFNFELLKYEFKYATQAPLVLNANWSNNQQEQTIEVVLDYNFTFRKNLSQVNFMIIIPTSVTQSQSVFKISLLKSEPSVVTQENDDKLQVLWQVASINSNGKITAKFLVKSSQDESIKFNNLEQLYQPVYSKFHIDNETLSQVKFSILSMNYKLSLMKERVETGKYFCNSDQQLNPSQNSRTLS